MHMGIVLGRKPAAGENFFWPSTLLYVTFSGLSEKGTTPWHLLFIFYTQCLKCEIRSGGTLK
jgi:hypothetical protein